MDGFGDTIGTNYYRYNYIPAVGRREIRKDIPALPFCRVTLTAQKRSYSPYDENLLTLGDHLRKRRSALGFLQQKDVAKLLGVSETTVYNWENNRSSPSLPNIPRVIEFLGYDPYITKKGLGGRIIKFRQGLGITQKDLAEKLGVDPTTLGYWERGERRPSGEMGERLNRFIVSLGTGDLKP